EDGSCIVTKPPGTGGEVSARTIKEQLLYEIGDPARYLSPDATVSFLGLALDDLGNDRVRVSGAIGSAPPDTYKVSARYHPGWRATASLTIVGRGAVAKARRCGEIVRDQLQRRAGRAPGDFLAECIGAGDAARSLLGVRDDLTEVVLRLSAFDADKTIIESFA